MLHLISRTFILSHTAQLTIRRALGTFLIGMLMGITAISHARAQTSALLVDLNELAARSSGKLGVCVLAENETTPVCIKGDDAFPLQSVMKLIVGAAVLDAVDRGELRLGDQVIVRPQDVSPGPKEFANLVKLRRIYVATVQELLHRSIVDSDSTSVDKLIEHIGGIQVVQNFIHRKGLSGVRIDRDERQLQSESVGLSWRAEYSDLEEFELAIQKLSQEQRSASWNAHLSDPRDKATPVGMVGFLKKLMDGRLLSSSATQELLSSMRKTATGNDRLRAGILPGWEIAHKTGTGRTWQGETETINDVGFLTAPNGAKIAIAVFLTRSRSTAIDQAAIVARVAALVCQSYGSMSN